MHDEVGDATGPDGQIGDGPVGVPTAGHRHGDHLGVQLGEPATVLPVHVHDARRGPAVEQAGLGLEVVLDVRMEVQMVLRQVGERTDREVHGPDPREGQRVRGDLHRDRLDTTFDHHGEQRLQVRGLRCGEGAGEDVRPDPGLDRADDAGPQAVADQAGLDQIARGGLAGGAGHPDDQQRVTGPAVQFGRQFAQHAPRVVHHQDGQGQLRRGLPGQRGTRRIGDHRHRAGLDGRGDRPGTVAAAAGEGGEQVTRLHLARPQGDPRDRHVEVVGWLVGGPFGVLSEVFQPGAGEVGQPDQGLRHRAGGTRTRAVRHGG